MKFSFKPHSEINLFSKDILVVLLDENMSLPEPLLKESKKIIELIENYPAFTKKYGDVSTFNIYLNDQPKTLIVFSKGSKDKLTNIKNLELGGMIASCLNKHKFKEAELILGDETEDDIQNICEGIKLNNYRFNKYFEKKKSDHVLYLETITVFSKQNIAGKFSIREKIASCTHFARDLVTEPGNALNPKTFSEICKELEVYGLEAEVLSKKDLESLGMHAILAVGQGSTVPPYVVSLKWNGDTSTKECISFIGKGVTFDTGGINIKPSKGLSLMKYDMGGAAVVTGLLRSLAERKAKINAVGVIGLAENMPSGSAQRPGDVITTMSGQTVEVDNTDAEGRLLLADVMWYAQEKFKPHTMIDLATLTGAIVVCLGDKMAGLFSNDDALASQLLESGKKTAEYLWRMPLDEYYDKLINSTIADVLNVGTGAGGGSITAAQFLQRFVKKECKWAHIDIAGVNWLDKNSNLSPKGATGFGVRLLNELVRQYYENC